MKKIFLFLLFPVILFSQWHRLNDRSGFRLLYNNSYTPVITIDASSYPVTPYENGWLVFDGTAHKQFARTSDLPQFEFIVNTTDTFDIETRVKVKSFTKAHWILGKYTGAAGSWLFGFNSNSGNTYEFYHTATGWKNFKTISVGDTNWYKLRVIGNRIDSTLKLYCNDTLVSTTTGFVWTSGNNTGPLSIGHASMLASYSDYTTGTGNPTTHFFHGNIDYLYIHKKKNGVDSAGIWNFNEGGGQQLYDSVTYLSIDASTPDGFRPGSHFMNGCFGSIDSQDVVFSRGVRKDNGTTTIALGTGLWAWNSSTSAFIQGFTNGLEIWQGKIIPTTAFNRVNVNPTIYTHNGDTAADISQWDNLTTGSKIGSNGSIFGTGGSITQAYGLGGILFVGGTFTNILSANGDYVLQFNGTVWDTCAKGFNNGVYCFNTYNGQLVAGGDFTASGATTITSKVATWNGTSWSAIGTNDGGSVWSLEVHNGILYAGTNQGLWYLNGTTWTQIDALAGATIYCLQSHKGQLWYGGTNGKIGTATTSGVTPMGITSGFTSSVIEFVSYNNDLYVIGSFFDITYNGNTVVCNKLARWNGREWSAVDYGIDQRGEDGGIWTYNGIDYLVVTGDLYWADGIPYNNIYLKPLN